MNPLFIPNSSKGLAITRSQSRRRRTPVLQARFRDARGAAASSMSFRTPRLRLHTTSSLANTAPLWLQRQSLPKPAICPLQIPRLPLVAASGTGSPGLALNPEGQGLNAVSGLPGQLAAELGVAEPAQLAILRVRMSAVCGQFISSDCLQTPLIFMLLLCVLRSQAFFELRRT